VEHAGRRGREPLPGAGVAPDRRRGRGDDAPARRRRPRRPPRPSSACCIARSRP
jgi:hypothetical protein